MIRKAIALLLAMLAIAAPAFASDDDPVFALVLSGGGARGLTHIAAIQELDRRGIVPDLVVGTSMGALVGALYAAGYDGDAMEDVALHADLYDAVFSMPPMRTVGTIQSAFETEPGNLLRVEIGKKGLGSQLGILDDMKVNGLIMRLFSKIISVDDFDDLPIPYRAIGTDIANNRTIVFGSGSFFNAVRSSMAIPVVFAPVILEDGSVVVDGGVTANLPVKIARQLGADYILAIDCNDSLKRYDDEDEASALPESLSGFAMQLIDTLASADTSEDALEADWLVSPDYRDFSTFDFAGIPRILADSKAAIASDEVQAVFDDMEAVLAPYMDDMHYIHYDELPVPLIGDVVSEGISGYYDNVFDSYAGRPLDYDTLTELESLLERIRRHEGLAEVSYRVIGDEIHIKGTSYPLLSGFLSLGLSGGIGVRYDGNETFFAYTPEFSVQTQLGLTSSLYGTLGVSVGEGIGINSGLTVPILDTAFFYLDLDLSYGQLSSISIPGTANSAYGRDVGLSFDMGIGYVYSNNIRLDILLGVDYAYLSGTMPANADTVLIPRVHNAYPYCGIGFVYDIYDGGNAADDGFETEVRLTIGGDFPDNMLSYSLDWEFFGIYGPSDKVKFFMDGAVSAVRRPWYLSSAFRVMTTGLKTVDYLYLLLGVRVPLPASTFIDIGAYAEGYSSLHPSSAWEYDTSLIPFATIDGYDVGGCLSGGIITTFGTIKATLYVSAKPRVSFMLEIL